MRLCAMVLLAAVGTAQGDARAAAQFVHALHNESTAPEYVLFTLRVPGRPDRLVCTPAPFLLGAIRTELTTGGDKDAGRKATTFAEERAQTRVFEFKQARAIQNVEPSYTPEILAQVESRLAHMGREQLVAELGAPASSLHRLYRDLRGQDWQSHRDAVAHVLLMRGVPVGHGDPVGHLYLAAESGQ